MVLAENYYTELKRLLAKGEINGEEYSKKLVKKYPPLTPFKKGEELINRLFF